MEKYQQIMQLAKASDQIYQLMPYVDAKYAETLLTIADNIADLADKIEEDE